MYIITAKGVKDNLACTVLQASEKWLLQQPNSLKQDVL